MTPIYSLARATDRGVGADVWEKRMGIPVHPDRAMTRSSSARAPLTHRLALTHWRAVAAAISIIGSTVAVVVGISPIPAALTLAVLTPAAMIDADQRRIPNVWVGAAAVALTVAAATAAAFGQPVDLSGVLGGAAAMGTPVLALHLVSPAAMGFGDVKAAFVLGAALGTIDWRLGLTALCVASFAGALAGLVTKQRSIAFGPSLVFGAWLVVMTNDHVVDRLFTGGALQ